MIALTVACDQSRFSPNTRTPAACASAISSGGKVLLTAMNVISGDSRPACTAAPPAPALVPIRPPSPAPGYEDAFPVQVMEHEGVCFVWAPEFDETGYFLRLKDARGYVFAELEGAQADSEQARAANHAVTEAAR
ncbi:MAG TPA: hypothetical protein VEI01_19000 [Terriglobales bacterium]|nr:hypothetical protein [Terriglobales bacterium]